MDHECLVNGSGQSDEIQIKMLKKIIPLKIHHKMEEKK